MVRLDIAQGTPPEVVYHEYTHSIFHETRIGYRFGSTRDWPSFTAVRNSKGMRSISALPPAVSLCCRAFSFPSKN